MLLYFPCLLDLGLCGNILQYHSSVLVGVRDGHVPYVPSLNGSGMTYSSRLEMGKREARYSKYTFENNTLT